MNARARKPPPFIGQLPGSTDWAVFNMPDTALWDATFPTRREAAEALFAWKIKNAIDWRAK